LTQSPYSQPLRIQPRPSRRLLAWLLATHGTAAGCALALPVPGIASALIVTVIGLGLGWLIWTRILALAPWSIRSAVWSDQGWVLEQADGQFRPARLLGDTWVGQRLVVLRFRVGRWSRALAISADAVDGDVLRRLRARLRLIGASEQPPAPQSDVEPAPAPQSRLR
jgi:hypothetical protein